MSDIVNQLLLQLVLILLNAFFAATEIAVISLNEKRVKARAEDGDKGWGRAAGEEDVLRADRIAAALRQIVGNSLLGLLRAACGRVAMQSKAVTL